jgi:hypothetical protein
MNNNNNPLWFNITMQINILEDRKHRLLEKRTSIDDHIAEIDHTIALLQFGSSPSLPSIKTRKVSVGSQMEIHLPKSKQLMTAPLTPLQKEEEEERKKRIFDGLRKKIVFKC